MSAPRNLNVKGERRLFLEVHVLQNFALSNLNRDDTGAPKTCDFGGARRARISSQCLKRAMRSHFRAQGLLPDEDLSYRTKLLKENLTRRLGSLGRGDTAEMLAGSIISHLGLRLKKEKTEYLLFVGEREVQALAGLGVEHEPVLLAAERSQDKAGKAKAGEVGKILLRALDGGGAVDLALFGRMIADMAERNVDAAVQVAHAFSTHAVATEFDFYSAVDDLQREDDEAGVGAGMLGTTLYNSSCYYRYANLDAGQLTKNLGDHGHRARDAATAFLKSVIHAVPSGKQTGSAAQNPPALVAFVVRDGALWSLANAFVQPVRPRADRDVVALSAEAMLDHFGRLAALYGSGGIQHAGIATYLDLGAVPPPLRATPSVDAAVQEAVAVLAARQEWN